MRQALWADYRASLEVAEVAFRARSWPEPSPADLQMLHDCWGLVFFYMATHHALSLTDHEEVYWICGGYRGHFCDSCQTCAAEVFTVPNHAPTAA